MTDALFSFEHAGETYTFEKSFSEVRKTGWLRANRRRDELDLAFTILEEIAGDDVLDVIDDMEPEEFANLSKRISAALNATFQ